jgi:hypothetical protein
MNKLTFVLLLFCCKISIAQEINYSINNVQYSFDNKNKENRLEAEVRIDRIQINVSIAVVNKINKWDGLSIIIVGAKKGLYPIGKTALDILNKTDSEKGTGAVEVNYWGSGRERISKSSLMGEVENTTGIVAITTVDGDKISGNFKANINGTKVEGNFKNIEVVNFTVL